MTASAKYIIGVHIDKEPRVRCQHYYTPYELGIGRIKRFAILGEDCQFEKWVKTFDGVAIELPIRIPHYAPSTFIECVKGKRFCGRTVEVYKLRPLASKLGAENAVLLVYSTAAWSSSEAYSRTYAKYIVDNLTKLLNIVIF